jgi:hypothetical protein
MTLLARVHHVAVDDVAGAVNHACWPHHLASMESTRLRPHALHFLSTLWLGAHSQGLTLVHFSAQPKSFWSQLPVSPCLIDWGKPMHQHISQMCLR